MVSHRRALLLVSVLAVALFDRAQSASEKEKLLVTTMSKVPARKTARQKTYAGKLRWRLERNLHLSIRFRDPRSMRDEAIPG